MKNEHSTLPEKISSGETLAGVQLCPFGEFPNGKTVQLCDEVAFNKIAANFAADGGREILCDFEHKSEDPSLTSDTAAAWISNVAVNKERGLVGDLKFTDLGAEAVTNRRLRFLSPVWTLDKGAGYQDHGSGPFGAEGSKLKTARQTMPMTTQPSNSSKRNAKVTSTAPSGLIAAVRFCLPHMMGKF